MKKIYLLFFSLFILAFVNAQDKKVMVVSEKLPGDDPVIKKIVDSIEAIPGIAVTHIALTDLGSVTYTNFDAALLTENGGSSSMVAFNDAGWPIPVVCLKAYILGRKDSKNPLFKQAPNRNWITSTKAAELEAGANKLIVLDNTDILKPYALNSEVEWTTNINAGSSDAHVQAFDLQFSVADSVNAATKAASTKLANAKVFVDNKDIPANLKTFMWKVEENTTTKRMVAWGVHHNFLENATADFYKILIRSMKWVLKMQLDPVSVKEASINNYNIYHNSVANMLNIDNATSIVNVNIIDMVGRVIVNTQNNREQLIQINTGNLVKGIYVCQITTVDGQTFSSKFIK
jgi:hypothetical protein